MSILSEYTKEELNELTKHQFFIQANYYDILQHLPFTVEVATLVRESTKHKDQEKAFEIQKDMMLDLIENNSKFRLQENNIFEEKISGLKGSARDAFQLMKRRAGEHKFDILIVDAVSRLARNQRDLWNVIEDFKELGIGIMIVKGNYWTYNMTYSQVMCLAVEGGLAQAESMQTGARVKAHMAEIAKSGQLLGGNMFGYRLDKQVDRKDNTLRQKPTEAYTVKCIFERFASDNPDEVLTSSSMCNYLIDKKMLTYKGDLAWTPSKIIRILDNTKYMGYQLPGKSRIEDTVRKKKVNTHVEPIRDEYDEKGVLIKKGNLVKGNWEPIVSEELWWKVYNRKRSRSTKDSENVKGRKSGLRVSADAYARKTYCSCGYALSREYTHTAEDNKSAQHRYKCRWQIMYANKYTIGATKLEKGIICDTAAVGEMKLWLSSKYVFSYLFKNGKEAVIKTLELIERCKQLENDASDGGNIQELEDEKVRLQNRLKALVFMKADGDIDSNEYKNFKEEVEKRLNEIESQITEIHINKGKQEKKVFDFDAIKERLETFIDLKGEKISSEMIDMFVERIIYRGDDEFLWVMNLSGEIVDTSAKYRINGYDEEYSKFLKDDKNFNIVARFIIPLEECENYCKKVIGRKFVAKFWKPITIKIAIQE